MTEKYDPVPDLAKLFEAALWGRHDVTMYADRIARHLGLSERPTPETIAEVLREVLGLDGERGEDGEPGGS